MQIKALIKSMRLRTLPLSLAGVVCGGILGIGHSDGSWWTFILVLLTACMLQVLSNLSNELGDHLSGVDDDDREGPNYSMADGGLTVKEMWHAINGTVVACCICGLLMLLFSYNFSIFNLQFLALVLLGAAAIWAATHYTLGKSPYGYKGLGDLFVFIFFGLVSVLGSHFVVAHNLYVTNPFITIAPAVGTGMLSVAVLNVNNIRDMVSDEGIRKTIPLRIGERRAKWYQTVLILLGAACFIYPFSSSQLISWVLFAIPVIGLAVHLTIVWRFHGKFLDPALPLLVFSTFFLTLIYSIVLYGIS